MKRTAYLLMAFVCVFSNAESSFPLIDVKLMPGFQEGTSAKIFFFSTKEKAIQQAAYCVGEGCVPAKTISLRKAAKDNPLFVYCASLDAEALHAGSVVVLNYSVDNDSTIYQKSFRLEKEENRYRFAQFHEQKIGERKAVVQATQATPPVQGGTTGEIGVAAVNAIRAAHGVPALHHDPSLSQAAEINSARGGMHNYVVAAHCWSGYPSIQSAVWGWVYNDGEWGGAHRNIVLGGHRYGGFGGRPGNYTFNAR